MPKAKLLILQQLNYHSEAPPDSSSRRLSRAMIPSVRFIDSEGLH
jgi:hypothetical protein